MKSSRALLFASAVALSVPTVAMAQAKPKAPKLSKQAQRGQYLVNVGGCHDCHTPLAMGPNGPAPDMSRALTGHPESMQLPPPPSSANAGPWIVTISASNTAWSGPWGISYPANLTPDKETGLGNWTEQQFIQALRTGKHMGQGRPILPPMPWQSYGQMTDEDLKSLFAYLKSLPPVKNRVPEPVPPAAAPGGAPAANPPAGNPQGGAPKK
jgi:cytochrome c553